MKSPRDAAVVTKEPSDAPDKRSRTPSSSPTLGMYECPGGWPSEVAADVGSHRQGASAENRASEGEAVQPPVGSRRSTSQQYKPRNKEWNKRKRPEICFEFYKRMLTRSGDSFQKWNHQLGGVARPMGLSERRSAAPYHKADNT